MKINRSLLMLAFPVALAVVPASAQGEPVVAQGEPAKAGAEATKPAAKTTFKIESPTMARSVREAEPVKAQAKGVFKTESPTMARSIRDWHPEPDCKTNAAKSTTQPSEETESPATRGLRPPQPGKRSEPAHEIPLKSIPE